MGKKTCIAALGAAAAAALLFAAPAQAGGASIHLHLGTPGYGYQQPYVYTQPGYVYSQPGYVYSQPSYVYYGQHGYYDRGHWRRGGRDRDHDGIRNRFDRDRDGDGVRNRHDRRPNNPYRY